MMTEPIESNIEVDRELSNDLTSILDAADDVEITPSTKEITGWNCSKASVITRRRPSVRNEI